MVVQHSVVHFSFYPWCGLRLVPCEQKTHLVRVQLHALIDSYIWPAPQALISKYEDTPAFWTPALQTLLSEALEPQVPISTAPLMASTVGQWHTLAQQA